MKLGWLLLVFISTVIAIKIRLCSYHETDCQTDYQCQIINQNLTRLNSTHLRISGYQGMKPLELKIKECSSIVGVDYSFKADLLSDDIGRSDLLFGIMGLVFIILWGF